MKLKVEYFNGNNQRDPGWYWEQNGFASGPFVEKSEAERHYGETVSNPFYMKILFNEVKKDKWWEKALIYVALIVLSIECWYFAFILFWRVFP